MARKQRPSASGSTWLNTYADMVTLLLTFFVVLLSMSSTDEAKFNAFIESFSTSPKETIDIISGKSDVDMEMEEPGSLDELYFDLKEYIEENEQEDFVEIYKIDDVVYIRFSSAMFFKPDQYVLLDGSIPTLDFVGAGLKERQEDIRMINVLGFTATVDNGSYWMLSAERAAAVAIHFNYESGLDSSKITVLGYGNQYPVAENDTEEGRKKNRRVELVVVGNESAEGFDITDALGQFYNKDTYPVEGSGADAYLPGNSGGAEEVIPPVDVATPPVPPIDGTVTPPVPSTGEAVTPPTPSTGEPVTPPAPSTGEVVTPPTPSTGGTIIPPAPPGSLDLISP